MIGDAWNIENPAKPWTDWDPEADVKIPVGLDDWLAELGVGYDSHEILTDAPLECASEGVYASGTILVRMKLVTAAVYSPGVKYPFTVGVFGDDGTTYDQRTLWLKVKDR
jgi:hypothetical protein